MSEISAILVQLVKLTGKIRNLQSPSPNITKETFTEYTNTVTSSDDFFFLKNLLYHPGDTSSLIVNSDLYKVL